RRCGGGAGAAESAESEESSGPILPVAGVGSRRLRSADMERLIIAVGLNENVTRDQNPNVPITPAEIAADIAECVDAGASIIHVHCRNPVTGEPIMDDPDGYLELFRTIHAEVDALVYPTYPNGEMVDRYKHVKALMED